MKFKTVCLLVIFIIFMGITMFNLSSSMINRKDWKNWGEYDNPIDQYYLPVIMSSEADDYLKCLKKYKSTWERELTAYLSQYEARCKYESDKKMVQNYLNAIRNYMERSESFLNCFNVDEETILWFHIQAYRCAFIEHVRGVYGYEWANIKSESSDHITNDFYQEFGGFDNPIDKKYLKILYSGGNNGAEFKSSQTNFLFSWGKDAEKLFEILFDSIDCDDIADYQESMDQWIDALNSRFWFAPEKLNAADADSNAFSNGMGTVPALCEEKGWIIRLYALQLRTVLQNCPEIEVAEAVE